MTEFRASASGPEGAAAIRAAREADLPALREIEIAAGAPFAAVGMTEIAEDEPPTLGQLRAFAEAGRAWVWVEDDAPVAYLILGVSTARPTSSRCRCFPTSPDGASGGP